MASEITYFIVNSYITSRDDTDFITGEENFREYAIGYYLTTRRDEKDEKVCTHRDIDEFLTHHDVTYFKKRDRSVYEEIITKHKSSSNPDDEYYPPAINNSQIYWISNGSMYTHTDEWVQTWDDFKAMKTDEIMKNMIDWGRQKIHDKGWGIRDIIVVTEGRIKQ